MGQDSFTKKILKSINVSHHFKGYTHLHDKTVNNDLSEGYVLKKNLSDKLKIFFMLSLPHLFVCFILSVFYFEQIIGIFLFGLFLPDIYYLAHYYLRSPEIRKKFKQNYFEDRDFFKYEWWLKKRASNLFHIFIFLGAFVFLYYGYYGVFLASALHMFLDLTGF